ncbi:MAG: hypothetical protein RL757_3270 [Bacteroidota bacterium]|jgi:imidazolonepropionase
MRKIITNIKNLVVSPPPPVSKPLRGVFLSKIEVVEDAFLLIEDQKIVEFGKMTQPELPRADQNIDANGGWVLPAFCDSHTHLVFSATREEEFEMRLKGKTYEEIAAAGGGILNSAKKLQQTDEQKLFDDALIRLDEARNFGTGAIEIKSGYGLTIEAELKMLRVIKKLKAHSDLTIRASFLGAHAVPMLYKNDRKTYISQIVDDMLPRIAAEGLADFVDVFCEKIAFSSDETDLILSAAARWGLRPKIHTNQFYSMGGIETALKHRAISVDHLEVLNENEIQLLQKSDTIATLLPTAPFFLNDAHTPPARRLIESDCAVALATDFNPGTSPSVSMPFVWSLACIRLRMLPEEALNAATINGAFAMQIENELGSIAVGKRANLVITKPISSLAQLPYGFTSNWIRQVLIGGE